MPTRRSKSAICAVLEGERCQARQRRSRPQRPARKRQNIAAGPPVSNEPIPEASGFAIDDLVSHPQFGDGTVTAIEKDKLTINFEDGRVKQIIDYYVKRKKR
jgi:hypothetical protein